MKLIASRRMDQALRALLHLADQGRSSTKAAQVAAAIEEPVSSVQQVLQSLARAGLVASNSSGAGGYWLARDPAAVSLLDVIETVEGPVGSNGCILRSHPCHWEKVCPVHRVWMDALRAFRDSLAGASLADLVADDQQLSSGTLPIPPDSHRLQP